MSRGEPAWTRRRRLEREAAEEAAYQSEIAGPMLGLEDNQGTETGTAITPTRERRMRIKSFELVNFRSYERGKFSLNDRTYIVGHNNAGKSTAIDGIAWGITGKCRGLDAASREIVELIREGQTTGLGVRIELEDFGSVQRQTDGKKIFLKVKDWSGSNKEQQDAFYQKTRISEPALMACLDTGAFLQLHHAEAKALIMGVMDVRIPAEDLEPLGIAGPLSLEELEARYKANFDQRTDAKRDLDRCHVPPAPEGEAPPALEELDQALADLRDQERELIAQGGEARGRLAELQQQREDLQTEKAKLEGQIAGYGDPHAQLDEVEEHLAQLEEAAPEGSAPGDGTLFGEASAPAAPAAAELIEADKVRVKLADDRGRLRMIETAIDGLEGHTPAKGCVLDPSVPCQTPAKEFTGKTASLKKDVKALQKSITEAEKRLEQLAADAERERKAYAERQAADRRAEEQRRAEERKAAEQRRNLETLSNRYKVAIGYLQSDTERLNQVLAELARVQTEIENLGEVQEPEGLAALRSRIERGNGIVAEARAWTAAQDAHAKAAAERAKRQARVDRFELLCDKLGPKGLILEALGRARSIFEQKVNRALAQWGYMLEFEIEPWTVRVNGRKSNQLSVSERLRVGVALQLAIAEISGLWFVAIDSVDTLDSSNREILADVIDGWSGQVLMAATKDPDFEAPRDLPNGVAFYVVALRDGLTEIRVA